MDRDKRPTKILSDEHQNILKVIDALLRECDAIDSGKELDKAFFEKAIDFIRNYADKFHHAKEEDILFKELCKDDVQMRCNPVEQMLYEHDTGRKFVKGMEEAVKNNDKEKAVENARNYAHLIQEHIYKEDNILYPMADQALDEDVQKTIVRRFMEVEKKLDKNKERLLSIMKELENSDSDE